MKLFFTSPESMRPAPEEATTTPFNNGDEFPPLAGISTEAPDAAEHPTDEGLESIESEDHNVAIKGLVNEMREAIASLESYEENPNNERAERAERAETAVFIRPETADQAEGVATGILIGALSNMLRERNEYLKLQPLETEGLSQSDLTLAA